MSYRCCRVFQCGSLTKNKAGSNYSYDGKVAQRDSQLSAAKDKQTVTYLGNAFGLGTESGAKMTEEAAVLGGTSGVEKIENYVKEKR